MPNLGAVLLPGRPTGANPIQHFMSARLVLPILQQMQLSAANLGNNHAHDFGAFGFEESQRILNGAGIAPLIHGQITEFHGLALLPLSFRMGYFADHPVIRDLSQLQIACAADTQLPLIILPHWGADYTNNAGAFERRALDDLAACGVAAVIGAHTHHASTDVILDRTGTLQAVFSMGNLLFDQTGAVSGALVELRRFAKGTVALRLIPVPNYFERLISTTR